MNLTINSKVKLNNGSEMPLFGLGVYQSDKGEETRKAVLDSLEAGYRHIDTAKFYQNEKDVGNAIKESGIPRSEIFVTTKLWNSDHGYDLTLKAFEKSLEQLDLGYIDLYLVHWPVTGLRNETWKAMEKIMESGKCKSIGVSNYTIKHLKELLDFANIVPAVNQVEFSPYLYQKELLDFCNKNSIQLEAYSPLTQGEKLKEKVLVDISKKYNKTTAQLILRWALQHNIVIIPKSVTKSRIIENANIFDFNISDEDMNKLDLLNENFRTCWDPSNNP
ncbi:MAG: aldo/keto reductase [Candidatus Sericytochromatia bacterium]